MTSLMLIALIVCLSVLSLMLTGVLVLSENQESKKSAGFFLPCCLLVLAMCSVGLHNNLAHVSESRSQLAALYEARQKAEGHLEKAAALKFDKVCTFNGYVSDSDWLKSDLHPCVERGEIRVWLNENRSSAGFRRYYKVGKIGPDGSAAHVLTYQDNGMVPVVPARQIGTAEEIDMLASLTPLLKASFGADEPGLAARQ